MSRRGSQETETVVFCFVMFFLFPGSSNRLTLSASMKTAVMSEGKSIRSLCTSQGPLSAITQNNRDSMVLADCAKHCSSLTPEEAERLSRIKMRNLYQLPFVLLCCLSRTSRRGNEEDGEIMFG